MKTEKTGYGRGAPKIGECRVKSEKAEKRRKWIANMTPERKAEFDAYNRKVQADRRAANIEKARAEDRAAYQRKKRRDAAPGLVKCLKALEKDLKKKKVNARVRVVYKAKK